MNIDRYNIGVVRGIGAYYGLIVAVKVLEIDTKEQEILVQQHDLHIWYSLTNGLPRYEKQKEYTTYQLDLASITNEFQNSHKYSTFAAERLMKMPLE